MQPSVSLDDLEHALFWVSGSSFENSAFVSRKTGQVFSYGADGPIDDDAPEDIEDGTEFIAIPEKNELDLGQTLVHNFVAEYAHALEHEVRGIFKQRGAYSRFKTLLQRHDLLDQWHGYEREATARALTAWAQENGFHVVATHNDA